MMAYFGPMVQWVGHSHLAIYLRDIPWVWPLCETIHFIGMALLIGIVGLLDLRMVGLFKGLPVGPLERLIPWGILGFAIKHTIGWRVSRDDEMSGIDSAEHGETAYDWGGLSTGGGHGIGATTPATTPASAPAAETIESVTA